MQNKPSKRQSETSENLSQVGISSTEEQAREQVLIQQLLETGFSSQEAESLLMMRNRLYENAEVRQRMADDCRLQFARWLYEHGALREN